jgi:hypothetical protein
VPARQEADQDAVDNVLLANDNLSDFGPDIIQPRYCILQIGFAAHRLIVERRGSGARLCWEITHGWSGA